MGWEWDPSLVRYCHSVVADDSILSVTVVSVTAVTARYRKGPLSQRAAIAKVHGVSQMSSCTVIIFLYPSIRVRTAPPVSVRVKARVSLSFSFTSNS